MFYINMLFNPVIVYRLSTKPRAIPRYMNCISSAIHQTVLLLLVVVVVEVRLLQQQDPDRATHLMHPLLIITTMHPLISTTKTITVTIKTIYKVQKIVKIQKCWKNIKSTPNPFQLKSKRTKIKIKIISFQLKI